MTELEQKILDFLRNNAGAWKPIEIAHECSIGPEVQSALHKLDDEGWVTMRNGLYKTSARALI